MYELKLYWCGGHLVWRFNSDKLRKSLDSGYIRVPRRGGDARFPVIRDDETHYAIPFLTRDFGTFEYIIGFCERTEKE